MSTYTVSVNLESLTCGHEGCGIIFAVPERWAEERREDHRILYCPKGHSRAFNGETDTQRLTREKVALQARLDQERAARKTAEHGQAIVRGRLEAAKRRARAGVCPDCHRSFGNVRRHMATKHPKRAEKA